MKFWNIVLGSKYVNYINNDRCCNKFTYPVISLSSLVSDGTINFYVSNYLLALKCDLRDDPTVRDRLQRYSMHAVQYEEGLAVARRIRASRYLGTFRTSSGLGGHNCGIPECSSKHNRGVTEVFYEAARVSLSTRARGSKDRVCIVM
jgi:hypothetical protein